MTERMTIAKTDITMLFRWSVSLYSVTLPRDGGKGVKLMWEDGKTNQDHACITPTTGFILTGIRERCRRVR